VSDAVELDSNHLYQRIHTLHENERQVLMRRAFEFMFAYCSDFEGQAQQTFMNRVEKLTEMAEKGQL
jgi:hypothetical protein